VRPSLLIALPIILFLFSGCVSKSTYRQQVDEADRLSATVQNLEKELQQLMEKQAELATRNDDLNQNLADALARNSALQQDLTRARADIDRLERVLSARSEQAGEAMAEMRRNIDQLEERNRELSQQVKQERIAREARVAQMKNTYDELVDKMESEIKRGEITISDLQGRLTVNMVERILFASGEAEVKPAGLEVLTRVGDILKEVADKEVRVEGYTDNIPISPRLQQTFPSNWELSTARATNVVHFLQDKVGIPGERLVACGYGENHPLADNATAEGRAQNRRIQIVLAPLEGGTKSRPAE